MADIHSEALFRQKEQSYIICRKMGGIGGHPSARKRWTQEDKYDTYFLSFVESRLQKKKKHESRREIFRRRTGTSDCGAGEEGKK